MTSLVLVYTSVKKNNLLPSTMTAGSLAGTRRFFVPTLDKLLTSTLECVPYKLEILWHDEYNAIFCHFSPLYVKWNVQSKLCWKAGILHLMIPLISRIHSTSDRVLNTYVYVCTHRYITPLGWNSFWGWHGYEWYEATLTNVWVEILKILYNFS